MARDQPLPPQTPSQDADPLSVSKTGRGRDPERRGGDVGCDALEVEEGGQGGHGWQARDAAASPHGLHAAGLWGLRRTVSAFSVVPLPPAHPPNKSAKLARATAFVDGTVDAGAKKRGRPRKWRDGYLYIYCLPPAGGRYAPKVINAPTAQS